MSLDNTDDISKALSVTFLFFFCCLQRSVLVKNIISGGAVFDANLQHAAFWFHIKFDIRRCGELFVAAGV